MDPAAREVRMAVGRGRILESGGADVTPQVFRNYFAICAVYQNAALFYMSDALPEPCAEYFVNFELLRGKADGRAQPGGTFPDALIAASCLRNAPLSRPHKLLALAGVHGNQGIPEPATQMRRVCGPTGRRWAAGRLIGAGLRRGSETLRRGE